MELAFIYIVYINQSSYPLCGEQVAYGYLVLYWKNVCVLGVNASYIVHLTTINLMQHNMVFPMAVGLAQDTC